MWNFLFGEHLKFKNKFPIYGVTWIPLPPRPQLQKEYVAKEPVYWNDFTLLDTATRYSRWGKKSYSIIFSRKIISVQEIYSNILFAKW